MKVLQLQEIVDERGVDIIALQDKRAPYLHVQGFTTVTYPFTSGKN
jgi:hypothetical protein